MRIGLVILMCCMVGLSEAANAPQIGLASVTGVVSVVRKTGGVADNGQVAIWLKRASEPGQRSNGTPLPRVRLKMVQRNKRFDPNFLVVPVGSVVDFPNADPFFHNVFSLFDGKRFDLGLYEAGTSRSVPFNTPGVCYIFCNIHPEMSAVVLVGDTPYYAVSNRRGEFTVPDMPLGRYALSVWHERYTPERPKDFPRDLTISAASMSVGVIRLIESNEVIVPHTNKYGHDYNPPPANPIYGGR